MNISKQFPIFKNKMSGHRLIYFDNAATTQKPFSVLDAEFEFYRNYNANVHRSLNPLAEEATRRYEDSRKKIAGFINANSSREVIFTSGTTAGINLVAQSLGRKNLKKGDRVVLTICEHHSNIVPWLQLKEEHGIEVVFIPLDVTGRLDMKIAAELINHDKTKLVSFQMISNTLGIIHPYKELVTLARSVGAIVCIDGSQVVAHMKINVQDLDCDFFVFSGHKMFGPTGTGILWGRADLLEDMPVWQGGGEMIREVFIDSFISNEIPYKFEAGTQNIAGVVGLGAAVDFLTEVLDSKKFFEDFYVFERDITKALLSGLEKLDFVKIYGHRNINEHIPSVAFTVKGMHAHDVGDLLGNYGIAVRSGHHCTQPLHDFLGVAATVRASLSIYNTIEQIDRFIISLKKVYKNFNG